MNNYTNIYELSDALMGNKYAVKYSVNELAYVNVLIIPEADKDTQYDLLSRTVASLPNKTYTFTVESPTNGTLVLRAYPLKGRTDGGITIESASAEEVHE